MKILTVLFKAPNISFHIWEDDKLVTFKNIVRNESVSNTSFFSYFSYLTYQYQISKVVYIQEKEMIGDSVYIQFLKYKQKEDLIHNTKEELDLFFSNNQEMLKDKMERVKYDKLSFLSSALFFHTIAPKEKMIHAITNLQRLANERKERNKV